MRITLSVLFLLLADVAKAQPEVAELERLASGRYTVPVMVNGQGPFPFLIDTAASSTSLSQDLARRLDLQRIRENIGFNAAGGQGRADIYQVGRIKVAGRDVRLPHALGIVRRRLSEKNIDGVLGMDVFRVQPVLFDFRENRLRFYSTGDAIPAQNDSWTHAALQPLQGGLPSILISISGSDVTAILDTGAGFAVANKATARLLDTGRLSKTPTITINGAGGISIAARTIRDVSFALADQVIQLPELAIADLPVFASLKLKFGPAVILGPDVFAGRVILLDYPNRRFLYN